MSHEINIRKNGVYILPTKGKYCDRDTALNVRIAGGGGTVTPVLQDKSATPTNSKQTFTADAGFDGIGTFTVEPIPNEYIIPNGTKEITTNGTHDVTDKASVSVNVPIPDGYIKPSGTIEITESGTYDVTDKASAVVNVSGGGDLAEISGEQITGALGSNSTTAFTINVGDEIPETFYFTAMAAQQNNTLNAIRGVEHTVGGTNQAVYCSHTGGTVNKQDCIFSVSNDRRSITVAPLGNTVGFCGGRWYWTLIKVG